LNTVDIYFFSLFEFDQWSIQEVVASQTPGLCRFGGWCRCIAFVLPSPSLTGLTVRKIGIETTRNVRRIGIGISRKDWNRMYGDFTHAIPCKKVG
jgi:hypothetical protein